MDSRICKHHVSIGPRAGSGSDAAIVRICRPVIGVQLRSGQVAGGVILYPPDGTAIQYPGTGGTGEIIYP